MKKIVTLVSIAMALVWIAGCSSSARKLHYYSLSATSPQVPHQVPTQVKGSLGIGPIYLPEMHTGDGVLTLSETQEIHISDEHLWAGDLKLGISRTLADGLSQSLSKDDVYSFPWDQRLRPDLQIFIRIERLSGTLNGELQLQAKLSLFDVKDKVVVKTSRVDLKIPSHSRTYGEYVGDINLLVNQLAEALTADFL